MKKLLALLFAACILVSSVASVLAEAPDTESELIPNSHEAYLEYSKDYLDKYDINGDGEINSYDYNIVRRAREDAVKAGEEYTGVLPSEIALFLVTAPVGRPGDYSRDGEISAKDAVLCALFKESCDQDGVEYPGIASMEEYDAKYGFPLADPTPAPTPEFTRGDVNGDGVVNAKDIILIMRISLRGGPQNEDEKRADVNQDGAVNAKDILCLIMPPCPFH